MSSGSDASAGARRRARLRDARLYLVTDARSARGDLEDFLRTVIRAGVDMVQLRDKEADDATVLAAAEVVRRTCDEVGVLFVVNDRPDLAVQAGADGVHVGQDDDPPAAVRAQVGPQMLIGRSTHSAAQIDAVASQDVDHVAVGPVHATPTKPGRPAAGLAPVRHAAAHGVRPWFAIGGIGPDTVDEVVTAGARRLVVVRAITQATDPAAVVRRLRQALDHVP